MPGMPRTPTYRLHKPSGQAVVRINNHDHYLGKHGSAESRQEYDRLIAEWLAGGRQLGRYEKRLSVAEPSLAYLHHCVAYYQKGGEPTSEVANVRRALAFLRDLYATTEARDFGPLALKAVRERIVGSGVSRRTANAYTHRVKAAFRWGVENELVPAAVWEALRAVKGLRKGRTVAPDHPRVKPATPSQIEAALRGAGEPVCTMILVQRLSGLRPGEVVQLCREDLDCESEPWEYRPAHHKTEHHDDDGEERTRLAFLGPQARALLAPLLARYPEGLLFRNPWTGGAYTTQLYTKWIQAACKAVGAEPFTANQLRHTAATEIRRHAGIEGAQVILGHENLSTTEIYAEKDREMARGIMEKAG
jgi:integrase